jgi:hypothetical protein
MDGEKYAKRTEPARHSIPVGGVVHAPGNTWAFEKVPITSHLITYTLQRYGFLKKFVVWIIAIEISFSLFLRFTR